MEQNTGSLWDLIYESACDFLFVFYSPTNVIKPHYKPVICQILKKQPNKKEWIEPVKPKQTIMTSLKKHEFGEIFLE